MRIDIIKPKHYVLSLCTIAVVVGLFYFFVHKGNNRFTVWYNHGVWVPKSTTNIKFITYPAFIVLTDDWAKSTCTMSKSDFQKFLSKQKLCKGCSWNKEGAPIPDTLKNRYPLNEEFKSPNGDFLWMGVTEIDRDNVEVYLNTDWN